jgi:hypothetical protein
VSALVLVKKKRADLPAVRIGLKEGPGLLLGCRPSFFTKFRFRSLLVWGESMARPAQKNHEYLAAFVRRTFVVIQGFEKL